jgi:hypothetical protein
MPDFTPLLPECDKAEAPVQLRQRKVARPPRVYRAKALIGRMFRWPTAPARHVRVRVLATRQG